MDKKIIILLSLVILLSLISIDKVSAKDCGGTVKCNCWDTLIADTTLTYDIFNCPGRGLIIGANNITLDCNGHLIHSYQATSYGIFLSGKKGVTIKNCHVRNFGRGIYLSGSSNNNLSNNTVHGNLYVGICLDRSSNNNQVQDNIVKKNGYLDICIRDTSCDNIIKNNIGSGNRPIKYFNSSVNLENEVLSELILCNADNSNLNNLTITGSERGFNNWVQVLYTDNSNFRNINSSNNLYGIYLDSSSDNNFSENTLNNNKYHGIYLYNNSNNNSLKYNIINSNGQYGIWFERSDSNSVYKNLVCNNSKQDFKLSYSSSDNTGDNNTCDRPDDWSDEGTTGCTYACPIAGDVNRDCQVNILDLVFVRNYLGQDPDSSPEAERCDVNGDGKINILDLVFVRNHLGTSCQ